MYIQNLINVSKNIHKHALLRIPMTLLVFLEMFVSSCTTQVPRNISKDRVHWGHLWGHFLHTGNWICLKLNSSGRQAAKLSRIGIANDAWSQEHITDCGGHQERMSRRSCGHPLTPIYPTAPVWAQRLHISLSILYGGYNTRRYNVVHGFCFFQLFSV